MAAPLQDFGRVVKALLRVFRWASIGLILVAVLVLGERVYDIWAWLEARHVALGWGWLAAVALGAWMGVGRPAAKYLRVPQALTPPVFPGRTSVKRRHLEERVRFLDRYIRNLKVNPTMVGHQAEIRSALDALGSVRDGLDEDHWVDAPTALEAIEEFERKVMEPLLAPLDAEANRVIRQEALAVGIGTAVSPYGTADAFIALWRNANLVARIATIYYGRPGPRGSLMILRDVASAVLVSAYLQGLVEQAGSLVGNWLSKTGNVLMGPVGEGAVNAVVTMRIGYVARGRCRSFRRWNEETMAEIVRSVTVEVSRHGAGVVSDIIAATVRSGVVRGTVEAVSGAATRTKSFLGSLFTSGEPQRQPE